MLVTGSSLPTGTAPGLTQTGYTAFSSAETPSQMAAEAQKGSDWSKVTQLPMADPQLLADEKRLDARMPHYDPVEPL